MADASVRFYPVGNGDATLVKFNDGKTMLIDANIREAEDEDGNETCYDVKADLKEHLRNVDGVYHLDAFILTHPDQDHCCGFARDFYTGDPDDFSKSDKEAERIVLCELWVAPRIFNFQEKLCDDAEVIKKESERRAELHRSGAAEKDEEGNRLRCVGFSDNEELEGLDEILAIPGERTGRIAGEERSDVELFIFAPVKADSDDLKNERNNTSIGFAMEFGEAGEVTNRLHFYGDNSRPVLERIYDYNKDSGDGVLEYDLALVPHHCSWGAFCEDKDGDPSETVKDLFKSGRDGAQLVSSSIPIASDRTPPSERAAEIYKDIVGQENFICTEEHPSEDAPTPLVYSLTTAGPVKEEPTSESKSRVSKGVSQATGTPMTYGRK